MSEYRLFVLRFHNGTTNIEDLNVLLADGWLLCGGPDKYNVTLNGEGYHLVPLIRGKKEVK